MDLEEEEEDYGLYIEELKSENPNLKFNAAQKIVNIAKVLGPARTREELIPYLVDIIEDQENDDEFLILLCGEIEKLKDHVGGQEHLSTLLSPLEIIGCMEENTVRTKAVNSLINLSKEDPASTISTSTQAPRPIRLFLHLPSVLQEMPVPDHQEVLLVEQLHE